MWFVSVANPRPDLPGLVAPSQALKKRLPNLTASRDREGDRERSGAPPPPPRCELVVCVPSGFHPGAVSDVLSLWVHPLTLPRRPWSRRTKQVQSATLASFSIVRRKPSASPGSALHGPKTGPSQRSRTQR